MWLIVTLITCVMIQLETATSFPPSPPTISLPLPSCWGMWAFMTMPHWQRHITYMPRRHQLHRPYTTHVDHAMLITCRIPSWPQHVNIHHATSMPPCQPLPHQPRHPNDESLTMGHEKRRRRRWDEEEVWRRWDNVKHSGRGRTMWATSKAMSSSYIDADNDASHRDGHRDACHIDPNANHINREDDPSHISCVDGGRDLSFLLLLLL